MASKEGPGLVLKHLGETILEEERAKRDLRRRLEVVLLERGLSDDSFEISKPGQPVDFSAGGMGFRKVPLQSKILRSIQELQAYKSALSQTPGLEGYEAGLSATGKSYLRPPTKKSPAGEITPSTALRVLGDPIAFRKLSPERQRQIRDIAEGRTPGASELSSDLDRTQLLSEARQAKTMNFSREEVVDQLVSLGMSEEEAQEIADAAEF